MNPTFLSFFFFLLRTTYMEAKERNLQTSEIVANLQQLAYDTNQLYLWFICGGGRACCHAIHACLYLCS
jgi:hypothetical protein